MTKNRKHAENGVATESAIGFEVGKASSQPMIERGNPSLIRGEC
jgi:hypothetical protein